MNGTWPDNNDITVADLNRQFMGASQDACMTSDDFGITRATGTVA